MICSRWRSSSLRMLLLAALVAGCRDVTSQAPAAPTPITVGPAGGTLILDDGAVALQVPAGALTEAVHIEARPTLAYPTGGSLLVPGSVYELTPNGLSFAVPASLTLRLAFEALPSTVAESDLRVYNAAATGWNQIAGSRQAANNYVVASITALGVYGLQGAPVATVTVSRDTVRAGSVGELIQLTAVARDAEGQVLPRRPVTWTTSDATHARVTANGLVEALTGTSTITATSEGSSASATVVVRPDAPNPMVLEDFSTYTGDANFLADPLGHFRVYEDVNPSRIHLDPTVAYGGSSQSMRYDFPDRTNDAGRCTDDGVSRWLRIIPNSDAAPQHIWAELYYKFSQGFTQYAPASWNCQSGAAYKVLFGAVSAMDATHQNSRFQIVAGQGDLDLGWPDLEDAVSLTTVAQSYSVLYPANKNAGGQGVVAVPGILQPNANSLFDGNWHQIRVEWKVSSALNVADGLARYWFDGVLGFDSQAYPGFPLVINRGGIYALALGANMNQGPAALEHLWYGRIRIFTSDPGW